MEILVRTTRSFTKKNPAQISYTQDYIDRIIPLLQTLYSQSAQWVLQQGGVPPPASNTIYLPPTCTDLQQLLSELHSVQSSLGMITHLNSKINTEWSVQPPMTSQANRIIEVETYNIHSVNKVLLQQILETIGQITKRTLDKNPQVMKLEPLILELYRQLTHFLFNLEAEENRKTGQISIQPEV